MAEGTNAVKCPLAWWLCEEGQPRGSFDLYPNSKSG
jgi:hypothetical protein